MLNNFNTQAQGQRIQLTKGFHNNITSYEDLKLSTFFQIYDSTAATHLQGDKYLRVHDNENMAAEFYSSSKTASQTYNTKAYKNYFLSFQTAGVNSFLIITPTKFGKTFALSNLQKATLTEKIHTIHLEITNCMEEYGYDAPSNDNTRTYFSNVSYTLKLTSKNTTKHFNFYSSDIKNGLTLSFESYSINIISDRYHNSSSEIEMIINKK